MRKLLFAAILTSLVVSVMPQAHADTVKSGKFTAADHPACAATCAYWADVTGDATTGFQACSQPDVIPSAVPAGQPYADTVQKAPTGSNLAVFEIFPVIDWDSFVCAKPTTGNNGEQLGQGANNVGDACDGILGPGDPTGEGCKEKSQIPVVAGKSYVFRGYNWSDVNDCPWKVTFKLVS